MIARDSRQQVKARRSAAQAFGSIFLSVPWATQNLRIPSEAQGLKRIRAQKLGQMLLCNIDKAPKRAGVIDSKLGQELSVYLYAGLF